MSSLIDASVNVGHGTPNGDCESGIIHFDATQRRKEKMRKKSQDAPAAESTPPPATPPVEPPKPVSPTPVAKTLEPAKPASNGAASHTPEPPAKPASALSKLSGEELETFLIDFVVEQTGYPPEMVELDADLEADLGIDSIKKAQLFGELAEQFEITVDVTDESLSLDDFPTLAHVMEFLQSQSGSPSATVEVPAGTPTASIETTPTPQPSVSPTPSANGNGVAHAPEPVAAVSTALAGVDLESFLVDFVVEQTGYPPEMVELDADLEADLGIDSIKKAQLFGELAEQFQITVDVTDESLSLDDFPTLRHVMAFLQSADSAPTLEVSAAENAPAPTPQPVVATPKPASNGVHSNGTPDKDAVASASTESETGSVTSLAQEELETFLINFVVEQTGYPPEMVELDADLEADLGIDSIKKAQMMGELAEQFEISVDVTDENLSLDDFPTLRHVCEFLASPGKVSA